MKATSDRTTALILGALLVVGMFYIGSTILLGTLIFAGFWATLRHIPLAIWFTERCPMVTDALITLSTFGSLAWIGVGSTTIWLSTAVAGLEASIWVALVHDSYVKHKRAARKAALTPHGVGAP